MAILNETDPLPNALGLAEVRTKSLQSRIAVNWVGWDIQTRRLPWARRDRERVGESRGAKSAACVRRFATARNSLYTGCLSGSSLLWSRDLCLPTRSRCAFREFGAPCVSAGQPPAMPGVSRIRSVCCLPLQKPQAEPGAICTQFQSHCHAAISSIAPRGIHLANGRDSHQECSTQIPR